MALFWLLDEVWAAIEPHQPGAGLRDKAPGSHGRDPVFENSSRVLEYRASDASLAVR